MIEALLEGLSGVLNPVVFLYMVGSTIIGLIFGLIPGLSGMTYLALLIPFTFGMNPLLAMTVLLAGHAVVHTAGGITAILINVPGTAANAPTLIDGFPLARQGHAGRAIGVAVTASGVGGVIGGIILVLCIPFLRAIVMAFGSPELFFLCVLGITFIATVAGKSLLKGLISGIIGIILSLIGFDAVTATARLTFGSLYLNSGIGIIPIVLGLFALPQVIELMSTGKSIAEDKPMATIASDIWEGVKDVFRHWSLTLRASLIGALIGAVPGVGAETAIWIAYAHAKQTSKTPELFGHGAVEGIIGPESANNSKEGGALIPTLSFGIPGSSGMAVMLGAFLVVGLDPGPLFLRDHLDICYAMVFTLVLANIIGALFCLFSARYLAKITIIPSRYLAPLILVLIVIGAYLYRENWLDIIATFVIGIIGLGMVIFAYPRPPLILGFVLGKLVERYFHLSVKTSGNLFFLRPLSLILIFLTIIGLFYDKISKGNKYAN